MKQVGLETTKTTSVKVCKEPLKAKATDQYSPEVRYCSCQRGVRKRKPLKAMEYIKSGLAKRSEALGKLNKLQRLVNAIGASIPKCRAAAKPVG